MTEQEIKIVEVLQKITNNFENISGLSTLLGWTDQYDLEGRIVTANPNSRIQYFNIDGKEYTVFRARWKVKIYFGKQGFNDTDKSNLITEIDLEPEYVKEYWKSKGY